MRQLAVLHEAQDLINPRGLILFNRLDTRLWIANTKRTALNVVLNRLFRSLLLHGIDGKLIRIGHIYAFLPPGLIQLQRFVHEPQAVHAGVAGQSLR